MKQSSKWLVRTLIILGIGIPIVVELTTLMGLVGNSFSDQSKNEKRITSEKFKRIEPGSELVPQTSQSEILKSAYVWAGSEKWEFSMIISISGLNNVQSLYFVFDSLETRNGTMLDRQLTFDKNINKADSTYLLSLNWDLPQGDQPKSVNLEATYRSPIDSVTNNYKRRLVFNKIPVRARK